jgi:cytochrome oxidase Cu insertion factor (SCO1/SenC/PrrC family)
MSSEMRRKLGIYILSALCVTIPHPDAFADPPVRKPDIQPGDVAPSLVALIANGDAIAEKPWDGKYVLVHFWSLKNVDRDAQFRCLKQLRKEFANDDRLRIISICVDAEERESWMQFQNTQGKVNYGDRRGTFDFYADHKWWQACQVSSEIPYSDAYGVANKGELFLVAPNGRFLEVRILLKDVRESIMNALNRGS